MKVIKTIALIVFMSISLFGCGNSGFSKSEIETAVNYAKSYLEYELINDLVGLSFNYSEPMIEEKGEDFYIVSFYAELYNAFNNKYEEPYYVELAISEEQITETYRS